MRLGTAGIGLLLAAALAIGSAATAQERPEHPTWMSGDAIRGSFSGRALAGVYPSGSPWTERIFDDGTTDYREGAKHWLGQWWVTAREFCFSYPPPGLGGCFRVVRTSPNCFELYEFSAAPARAEEPPGLADQWNGRMWLAEQPTTCEQRPVS